MKRLLASLLILASVFAFASPVSAGKLKPECLWTVEQIGEIVDSKGEVHRVYQTVLTANNLPVDTPFEISLTPPTEFPYVTQDGTYITYEFTYPSYPQGLNIFVEGRGGDAGVKYRPKGDYHIIAYCDPLKTEVINW